MISEDQINDLIESNEDHAKAYFIWQMDEKTQILSNFILRRLNQNLTTK